MTSASAAPGLARILPALALYHILLIAGAFLLLLVGVELADEFVAVVGGALMALGVALQFFVIRWSIRQSRSTASLATSKVPGGGAAIAPRLMLCTTCAWEGTSTSIFCPRCHRVLVRPFRRGGSPTPK